MWSKLYNLSVTLILVCAHGLVQIYQALRVLSLSAAPVSSAGPLVSTIISLGELYTLLLSVYFS